MQVWIVRDTGGCLRGVFRDADKAEISAQVWADEEQAPYSYGSMEVDGDYPTHRHCKWAVPMKMVLTTERKC